MVLAAQAQELLLQQDYVQAATREEQAADAAIVAGDPIAVGWCYRFQVGCLGWPKQYEPALVASDKPSRRPRRTGAAGTNVAPRWTSSAGMSRRR